MRTDRLQQNYPDLHVIWRDFPLHPEVPEEGIAMAELFAGSGFDLAAAQARLEQIAAREGVELAVRERTCNSRRAQELGKWAESLNRGDAWRRAVYRSVFVEGRNIGVDDELLRLTATVDLDPQEAQRVLNNACFATAVDADGERAVKLGIHGVPAYRSQKRLMTGFHPYEDYLRLLGR